MTDQDRDEVELSVYDHGVTKSGKAMCYTLDGNTKKRGNMKFLPLSQIIEKTTHPKNSAIAIIRIPEWLAKKEGLI
jgi:hypothetical protein